MEKMISRMIAKDGFTFDVLCKSTNLKYLFLKNGFMLQTSFNTIRSRIITFSDPVQTNMKNKLAKLQGENQIFSLTFDEGASRMDSDILKYRCAL